jgi:hypothetical protein
MRKALTAAIAAITFGGAVAATALPAEAQSRGGHYRQDYRNGRHHDNNDAGVAIAAGVVGLALGAALSSNGNRSRGYYNQGYYDRGYAYGPRYGYAPRVCESSRWVWDRYYGRRVLVRERYAC